MLKMFIFFVNYSGRILETQVTTPKSLGGGVGIILTRAFASLARLLITIILRGEEGELGCRAGL